MPFTIADARQVVLEALDDETGVRFARLPGTNTVSYVKIDRALRVACTSALDDYRGDRFDETIEVTSSTAGEIDLASYKIHEIKSVRVSTGVASYRVMPGDAASGGRPDSTARDLVLTITRRHEIPNPPDTDDLLLGTTAGAARSWDAFDQWVCLQAAKSLGIKTLEAARAQQLVGEIAALEKSVKAHKRIPGGKPWPERRTDTLYLSGRLRWLWDARTQTMSLVHGVAV
jgi:hypothetical protein